MPNFIGTATYMFAKGSCYRCTRNERLVDTDVFIEGEGALALCVGCISDFAETAGLVTNSAAVRELEAKLAAETAARLNAQKLEAELQAALNRLRPKTKAAR